MSKLAPAFLPFLLAFLLILQSFNIAAAQSVEAEITVDPASRTASVSGRFVANFERKDPLSFYFLTSVPGSRAIADRISDLKLTKKDGSTVGYRKLGPGEFLAEEKYDTWSYTVAASGSNTTTASAHASWIADDKAVIMLDDLLPKFAGVARTSGSVTIKIPAGWQIETTGTHQTDGSFLVTDVDRSVFLLGRNLTVSTSTSGPKIVLAGKFLFTEAEAAAMSAEIFAEYQKLLGERAEAAEILIIRYPDGVQPGAWQAETRGNTLTIVSSDMNFRTQSLQRLHEQLRHEIFHLWLPNGVDLTGNYDWFYEGFALYESLKLAVALNRIRFDDFLDTLSRAYSIDAHQTHRRSLVDASRDRFTGNDTQVYARGMLVAFLADVSILDASRGRRSVSDLLRKIVSEHARPHPPADALTTVLAAMRSEGVAPDIIAKYVQGTEDFDLSALRAATAIELTAERNSFAVNAKRSSRQKVLLDKLGYNNWRKLSSQ